MTTLHDIAPPTRGGTRRLARQDLTPRQQEIAGLLARGLSNREIGAELVLTAGTVANHVRAILLRTGFRTRAQVAAWLGVPDRIGLEAAPDATVVVDGDGRVLTANPAFVNLLERCGASLEGMPLAALIDDCACADEMLRELADAGVWQGESSLRRSNGTSVTVETSAQALDTPAGTLYVAAFRDLSQRQEIARRQREFVAMLGHELRSPLAAIRGYAQLMQARGEGNPASLDVILHQTRRLERLTNDLIDLTRQDIGLLQLHRDQVDLVDVARSAAAHARAMAPSHLFEVDAGAGELVGEWDRGRLEQILDNLLSNAVKYSPDGGRVLVRLSHRGPSAELSVVDEGVGIPPEALPHLFDRFYRVERPGEPVVEGMGLGLAVARALVEAHGGRISASSGPGCGATVTLLLPYRPPEGSEEGPWTG